jgi:hypothetical protein
MPWKTWHTILSTEECKNPFGRIQPLVQNEKRVLADSFYFEASTGFEPVMRVLQTLALPLGHDANPVSVENQGLRTEATLHASIPNPSLIHSYRERAMGFEPTTFSLARRRSTTELRPQVGNSFMPRVPRPRIELGTPQFSVACSTS